MTPLESQKEGVVFALNYTLSDRQIGLKGLKGLDSNRNIPGFAAFAHDV